MMEPFESLREVEGYCSTGLEPDFFYHYSGVHHSHPYELLWEVLKLKPKEDVTFYVLEADPLLEALEGEPQLVQYDHGGKLIWIRLTKLIRLVKIWLAGPFASIQLVSWGL